MSKIYVGGYITQNWDPLTRTVYNESGNNSPTGVYTLNQHFQALANNEWVIVPAVIDGPDPGSNLSANSIYDVAKIISNWPDMAVANAGGTLTVNSVNLGSYDYVKKSTTTVSSFSNIDWFTSTTDTRPAFVAINGNLTINSGQTFIPTDRKLFVVIYVTGTLTINGSVSMSQRGSNHSGTGNSGGSVTAAAIRIINGTYSSVSNPQIPAAGGGGGNGTTNSATGNSGTNGSAGGTGGGGGGIGYMGTGGNGSAGTSFSGGTGGGGASSAGTGTAGTSNGGRGGDVGTAGNWCGAGAGNPHGTTNGSVSQVQDGTGGVLIIICNTLAGSGSVTSTGATGSQSNGSGPDGAGGGSGGGSVNIITATNSSTVSASATGGAGGRAKESSAFIGTAPNGGNGTSRILTGTLL